MVNATHSCTHHTRGRVQALTGLHLHTDVVRRYWCPGSAGSNGSIPLVGIKAAIAAGQLPYPSRTRKISPPAFRSVLECASLWEIRFAACHSYFRRLEQQQRCSGLFAFISRSDNAADRWVYARERSTTQWRQGGRVRPNAAACRAAHRRFKSGPWLSFESSRA